MNPGRPSWAVQCTVVVAVLCCSPLVLAWWRNFSYAQSMTAALEGQIEFIEFLANTDWPKQRLTDPRKIASIKSWLLSAAHVSQFRSAPPRAVCEMRFVFRDGHEEVILHSPFQKRLGEEGRDEYRDDVVLRFRNYVRSGPTAELADILDPAR